MKQYSRALSWVSATDRELLCAVRRFQRSWLTLAMLALTFLCNATTLAVLAIALLMAGGSSGELGLEMGTAALLSLVLSFPLKRVCSRARPSRVLVGLSPLVKDPDSFSFPSGHTCAAFAIAWSLGPAAALMPLALALAAGVGFSRVYLGAHFPMDVVAGAMLGSGVGLLVHGAIF